jgi:dihydroorotate dehydrogenase
LKRTSTYRRFIFPFLSRIDAEEAHQRVLSSLVFAQRRSLGRAILRLLAGKIPATAVHLFGLNFPNILGVAAGFDKDVHMAPGLAMLGFGHIEVGTITPRPQAGNPKPRIYRLPKDEALINRMGFPNDGVKAVVSRLRAMNQVERPYVLGVSLGKQKNTALENAAADYASILEEVFPYADYLAINVSSPNTPELRKLQGSNYLGQLLDSLMAVNRVLSTKHGQAKRPLLIKISPDLSWPEVDDIVQTAIDKHVDGVIAANTTIERNGLKDANQAQAGGLSGPPLALRSTQIIRHISKQTNGRLPIIGVGGIRTAADVQAKVDAGASLVQLYTALVYEGPRLPGRILRELSNNGNVVNRQT